MLATNAAILARVRAEHILVFGSDAFEAASIITSSSSLLNKIPCSVAVIKQVLQMYSAASGIRAGEANFRVTDNANRNFPMDGFLVWDNPQAVHRDPAYWPRPDGFLPERWLVAAGNPLHPIKGAWRPFSHGPRSCIRQELAMIEMKVIMVMTARRSDIQLEDYQKYENNLRRKGFQIQRAPPSDDLSCRVAQTASWNLEALLFPINSAWASLFCHFTG